MLCLVVLARCGAVRQLRPDKKFMYFLASPECASLQIDFHASLLNPYRIHQALTKRIIFVSPVYAQIVTFSQPLVGKSFRLIFLKLKLWALRKISSALNRRPPMKPNAQSLYRPDIDGLRAIAVMSVIAFHAFPRKFNGGFIGVDIFFVISGYLITGLIYRALREGHFSLLAFYTRRMKRLLPSFIVVSVCTLISSSYLLIPNDYVFFTTSLAASWAFVANVFFSMLSWGYFGQRSEGFPLLHTWSLSVEEQFYFVFPLLLIFMFRYCRRWLIWLCLLAAIVFVGISEYGTHRVGSYFLLPYRAHELLIGSLTFFAQNGVKMRSRGYANAMAVSGLVLMLGTVFFFQRDLPFPGVRSLIPCLGVAMLLYSGAHKTAISNMLSSKPLVFVGLMSYTLYLWHWPIFSFLNYRRIEISLNVSVLAIGLTCILSFLTWKLIEEPIRRNKEKRFRTVFAQYYLAPAALFLSVGLSSYATEGAPQRFSQDLRQLISSYSFERDLTRSCAIRAEDRSNVSFDYLESHCAFGDLRREQAEVLLFGDSHAHHFKPFLDTLTARANLKSVYHVEGGCDSVDLAISGGSDASACQRRNQQFLNMAGRFKYVVLASSWSYLGKEAVFKKKMMMAVQSIIAAHAIPIVFKDNPSTDEDLSQCILFQKRGWSGLDKNCSLSKEAVNVRHASIDQVIDAIQVIYPSMLIVDPKKIMCDSVRCITYIGNTALYKDANHLNTKASMLLADRYLEVNENPFLVGRVKPFSTSQRIP